MENNVVGDPGVSEASLFASSSQDTSSSLQPGSFSCVSGQRDYFTSSSLISGWSDRQTIKGERLYPSSDYLYYAIQCNNGQGIGRGDLFMMLYDPKCDARRQSFSFSNLVVKDPSSTSPENDVINLDPGWHLVCVHAYTSEKRWLSTLAPGAPYSKFSPDSILSTQVLWIPVNIFPAINYHETTFQLKREATLSCTGYLIARTEGVSQVFYPPDPNRKKSSIPVLLS